MIERALKELVMAAVILEDLCRGCSLKDSKECGLCEKRLQARFDDLNLGEEVRKCT